MLPDKIRELLITGALEKGGTWGGEDCRKTISIETHILESGTWTLICVILYFILDIPHLLKTIHESSESYFSKNKRSLISNIINYSLGSIHMFLFGMLIFYKYNISSLVNLLQPCHMILLLQGIALLSKNKLGVIITIFMLPALVGCFVATITPDTSGLDQILEIDSYWYQHYVILIVPFYLLMRDDFLIGRITNLNTVFCGLWLLTLIHFVFFEIIDLLTNVNVEFMLCPSSGMMETFESVLGVPRHLVWPTHRSFMTYLVIIIAMPLSFVYIFTSHVMCYFFGRKNDSNYKHSSQTKKD